MSNIKDIISSTIKQYVEGKELATGSTVKNSITSQVSDCFSLLRANSLNPASFNGLKKYIAQQVLNEKLSYSSTSEQQETSDSSTSSSSKIYTKFNEDESTVKGFVAMAGNEAFICPYQNQFNYLSSNYWTPHGLESNKLTFKKFFPTSSDLNSSSDAKAQNRLIPIGNGKVFIVNKSISKAYIAGRSDVKAIKTGVGCLNIDFATAVSSLSNYVIGKMKLFSSRYIVVQLYEFVNADSYTMANKPPIDYKSIPGMSNTTQDVSKCVWFTTGYFLIFDIKYNTVQKLGQQQSRPSMQRANLCSGYNDFIIHQNKLFFVKSKDSISSQTCNVQTFKIEGRYATEYTTSVPIYSSIKASDKVGIKLDGYSFYLNELSLADTTEKGKSFSIVEIELDKLPTDNKNMFKFSNASIPTMCKLAANDSMPFKFYAQLYYSGIAPFSTSSVDTNEIYSSFEFEYAANKLIFGDPSKYTDLLDLFSKYSKDKKIIDFNSVDLSKTAVIDNYSFIALRNINPLYVYGAIHGSMDLGTCAIYNGQLIFELQYELKNNTQVLKTTTLVYELSGEPGICFSTFHDISKLSIRPLEIVNTSNRLGPYMRMMDKAASGSLHYSSNYATNFSYSKANFISFGEIVLTREIIKAVNKADNNLSKLGLKLETKTTELDKYLTDLLLKDINTHKDTKCQDCIDYCKELYKNEPDFNFPHCDKLKYAQDTVGFRWVLGKDLEHSVVINKYTNEDSKRYWACEILMRLSLSSKMSFGRYEGVNSGKSINEAYRFECPDYSSIPYEGGYKNKGNYWLSGDLISPYNVLPIPQPNIYSFFGNNLEYTSSNTPSLGGMNPANETFLVTFSGNEKDKNIRPILVFSGGHMFNVRAGAKYWAYRYPEAGFYDPFYMYTGAPLAVELGATLSSELSFLSSLDYSSKVDSRSALLGHFGGYYTEPIINTEMKWENLFSSQIKEPEEAYSILGFAPGIYFTRNGSNPIEGRNKLVYDISISPANNQHIIVGAFHQYCEYDTIDKKYTINNYALDAYTFQMPLEHKDATLIPIGIADPMTYWWSKTIPAPKDTVNPLWGICKIFPEATL